MNTDEARRIIDAAIQTIAPEADPASIDRAVDFREVLDLDSMDFINLVIEVAERTGLEIPERDYPKLATLSGFTEYVANDS